MGAVDLPDAVAGNSYESVASAHAWERNPLAESQQQAVAGLRLDDLAGEEPWASRAVRNSVASRLGSEERQHREGHSECGDDVPDASICAVCHLTGIGMRPSYASES